MIPYSRPKLSVFYTLFESKLAENHTLRSGTYLYSSYMGVPPPHPGGFNSVDICSAGLNQLEKSDLVVKN